MTKQTPRKWLNGATEHEGYPIHFRRPDVRVAEFDTLRPRYPSLLVITLQLAKATGNGLPEADYNMSLMPFDEALLMPFEDESHGVVAVVETFAGKRTYYIYLLASFDAERFLSQLTARFPDERLTSKLHDDPEWKLLKGYARDFQFP